METVHAPVTVEECDASLKLLEETHDQFVAAISPLSEAQWRFKPAPETWSIAQNVEHVVKVEESIQTRVFAALKTGPPPERDAKTVDQEALRKVVDRSFRIQAPDRFSPAGDWELAEAIRRFGEARKKTMEVAKDSAGFRDHTVAHPVFGPLDGYQWILTIAQHRGRHASQIGEVKQAPDYPAR